MERLVFIGHGFLDNPYQNGGRLRTGSRTLGSQGKGRAAIDHVCAARSLHGAVGPVVDLVGISIAGQIRSCGGVKPLTRRRIG